MGLKQWDAFYEEDEDFDIHAHKVRRRSDHHQIALHAHNITFDDVQLLDTDDDAKITDFNPYAILR